MKIYIDDTRAAGANIIFITPTPFSRILTNYTMRERALAMIEVAKENRVTLLDLNRVLNDTFDQIGRTAFVGEAAKRYFLVPDELKKPVGTDWGFGLTQADLDNHSNGIIRQGSSDTTHPNERGADFIAKTIAQLLKESGSLLKNKLDLSKLD